MVFRGWGRKWGKECGRWGNRSWSKAPVGSNFQTRGLCDSILEGGIWKGFVALFRCFCVPSMQVIGNGLVWRI